MNPRDDFGVVGCRAADVRFGHCVSLYCAAVNRPRARQCGRLTISPYDLEFPSVFFLAPVRPLFDGSSERTTTVSF